jgi:hypothetical protein
VSPGFRVAAGEPLTEILTGVLAAFAVIGKRIGLVEAP